MSRGRLHIAVLLLLSACAGTSGAAPNSELVLSNASQRTIRAAEVNVVTRYGAGEFQTVAVSPYDQFFIEERILAGETRTLPYRSLSEQFIDIRITWEDGTVHRFNVGYRDDLFSAKHTVTATDTGIVFDGRRAAPVNEEPEETYRRTTRL